MTEKKHSDILKELSFLPMILTEEQQDDGKKLLARIESVHPNHPVYQEPIFVHRGSDTIAADENGIKWAAHFLIDLEPFGFRNATEEVLHLMSLSKSRASTAH